MKKLFAFSVALILVISSTSFGLASLVDNGDETITDDEKKLVWLKNVGPGRLNWQSALDWADELDDANFHNWRIPTVVELEDMYYRGLGGEAGSPRPDFGPFIIQPFEFQGNPVFLIWSSTDGSIPQTKAIALDFNNGGRAEYLKDSTLLYWAVCDLDGDGDGIADNIDLGSDTHSNSFSDGTTTGIITNRGEQEITITLGPDGGFLIATDPSGGTEPATIQFCNGGTIITLGAGADFHVRCGNTSVKVNKGSVEVTFYADGWTQAKMNLNEGNIIRFDSTTRTLSADSANANIVVFNVERREYSLAPGESKTIEKCPLPIGLLLAVFIVGLLLGLLICWLSRRKKHQKVQASVN